MNSRQVSSDTINDNYATIEASPPKSQILISYNLNLKVRPGHFEIIRFILRNTCLILLPPTSVVHEDQERRWQQNRQDLWLQPKVSNVTANYYQRLLMMRTINNYGDDDEDILYMNVHILPPT